MTPIAKGAAVLIFCAGVAFAGLMATGPGPTARARRDPDLIRGYYPVPMPRYPGAKEYPLTRSMKVGQSGLKMSYFYTRDDPLKVANFYADRWLTKGYHVTRDITLAGGSVSALDVKAGVTRQVLIQKKGRTTAVFPSVYSGLTQLTPNVATGADPITDTPPVFPGAEGVMTFGSKDHDHTNKVTMFLDHGGLEANVEFYKVEMVVRGWIQKTHFDGVPGRDSSHHVLLFKKSGREVTINLMRVGKTNQVRVHITEVKPR
jgi:hypothetical protein